MRDFGVSLVLSNIMEFFLAPNLFLQVLPLAADMGISGLYERLINTHYTYSAWSSSLICIENLMNRQEK